MAAWAQHLSPSCACNAADMTSSSMFCPPPVLVVGWPAWLGCHLSQCCETCNQLSTRVLSLSSAPLPAPLYSVHKYLRHRDNTLVHINYKSQFKEGSAIARHTRTTAAGDAPNSRKKNTRAARGKKGAAAAGAAGGGFTTAAANFLAGTASGSKRGRKGGSGGRRGSKKSGGGRSRASGGGGAGGSGGQKKRGRRVGWRYVGGKKVGICSACTTAEMRCACAASACNSCFTISVPQQLLQSYRVCMACACNPCSSQSCHSLTTSQ